jgi:hypothetical protein
MWKLRADSPCELFLRRPRVPLHSIFYVSALPHPERSSLAFANGGGLYMPPSPCFPCDT